MASKWGQMAETISAEAPEETPINTTTSKWAEKANVVNTKEPSGAGGSYETLSWIDTLKSAAINTPKSGYEYGKGIYEAVRHPIQTGKAINEAFGTLEIDPYKSIKHERYDQTLNQITDFMKQRYGSIERFKDTLAEDPVGVLADISSVVMPAGKLAGVSKLTKVGAALEPMSIPLKAASLPFKLVPKKIPMQWYKSAVKFGTTLTAKQRTAVTKTALNLEYKIMPTNKGLLKLKDFIDDYNSKITMKINEAFWNKETIHIDKLYQGLESIKDKFKAISDEPLQWDKAFDGIKGQWEEALKIDEIRTPQQVQKIKQRIYKDLESYYEKLKSEPAKTKLRMAIASNARKALEDIVPEIKQLNKKEGALIDLWKALETKANRITNRDLIGIGIPVKMGTGAGVGYMFGGEAGGKLGSQLGLMLGVFDTPQVKARMAIILNTLIKKGIKVKPTPAAIKLGLFQAGRSTENEVNPNE